METVGNQNNVAKPNFQQLVRRALVRGVAAEVSNRVCFTAGLIGPVVGNLEVVDLFEVGFFARNVGVVFVGRDSRPVAGRNQHLDGDHAVGIQVFFATEVMDLACGASATAQKARHIGSPPKLNRLGVRGNSFNHHDPRVRADGDVGVDR